ncbi:MAG: hypothetical protein QW278_04765 [Desulfurococcaceae archaeon]
MKAVESIIGTYLMILVLIGLFAGMYTWLRSSFVNLRDSFNQGIYRIAELMNPPVLSLNYINGSLYLEIYTYMPMKLKEIVVADVNNYEKVHTIEVNRLVDGNYTEQFMYNGGKIKIYVLSDNGIVYYYIPKNDPRLAKAPDYIKNKPYIDEELVSYIINGDDISDNTGVEKNSAFISLDHLGYKVFIGGQNDVSFNNVFTRGPILCGWGNAMYDLCYIGIPYNPASYGRGAYVVEFQTSFFTLGFETGKCWSMINGLMSFDVSCLSNYLYNNLFGALLYPYIQVFRIIYGKGNISLVINISIGSFDVRSYFMPVIYIYSHDADIRYPVVIGQPTMNEWPGFKPYLARIALESDPRSLYNTWYNKTYVVTIDTTKYWIHDVYILIGVETSCNRYGSVNVGVFAQVK